MDMSLHSMEVVNSLSEVGVNDVLGIVSKVL